MTPTWPVCVVIAILIASAALPAQAQQSAPLLSARTAVGIGYKLGKGAESCPTETELRESIKGRLGRGVVELVDATAGAPKTIDVTIARRGAAYVGSWERTEGGRPAGGHEALVDDRCGRLVDRLAVTIAADVVVLPTPEPRSVEREASTATAALPAAASPPPAPTPSPPVPAPPAPRPGVFEGPAGIARAVAFAFAGASIATGTGFAAGAAAKLGAVREVQAGLAPDACHGTSAGACGRLASLLRQHDTYANAAIGLMVAGGLTAGAAAASIWIIRTPARAVEVNPAAPGALAGLSLRGAW